MTTQPPSYEEARAALAEIVGRLEAGDTTLEEALTLWEQGEEWARVCSAWLAGAQERLTAPEDSASSEPGSSADPAN